MSLTSTLTFAGQRVMSDHPCNVQAASLRTLANKLSVAEIEGLSRDSGFVYGRSLQRHAMLSMGLTDLAVIYRIAHLRTLHSREIAANSVRKRLVSIHSLPVLAILISFCLRLCQLRVASGLQSLLVEKEKADERTVCGMCVGRPRLIFRCQKKLSPLCVTQKSRISLTSISFGKRWI